MPELLDIATRIAGWARAGEDVEAYVVHSRTTEVVSYETEIESLSSADSDGVGVRVVRDQKQGFAWAGSLDDGVLRETLDEARDNAGFGTPDEHFGLARPDGVAAPALDVYRDELASFPTAAKVEMAIDLERRVRAGAPRIRQVESAQYSDTVMEAAVATTTDIASHWRRTACSLAAVAIAGDGDDSHVGEGDSVGRSQSDLDPAKAEHDAIERATRLLGAKKPKSTRLTVVFDGRVASQFLGLLGATLNGELVLKGRSLFANRLGEPVAAPVLTLVEDPTDPAAYLAGAYDSEGLATRRTSLIEAGVLRAFLYNTYAARRAGAASTGSAVRAGFKGTPGVGCRAVQVVPGDRSQDEILRDLGEGLLVLSVTGLHSGVNPVSGDFSVGAEGVMFRNGEPAEPVRELTIASTLQRMLQGVVAVGNDVEWLPGNAAAVTLGIGEISVGGE